MGDRSRRATSMTLTIQGHSPPLGRPKFQSFEREEPDLAISPMLLGLRHGEFGRRRPFGTSAKLRS
jgi:hypothetical protein